MLRERERRGVKEGEREDASTSIYISVGTCRLYENMKRGTRGREQGKKRKDRGQREAKTASKNKKIKIEGDGRGGNVR